MAASKYITTDCHEQTELFRMHSEFSVTNAVNFMAEFMWVLKQQIKQVWLCIANYIEDDRKVEGFVAQSEVMYRSPYIKTSQYFVVWEENVNVKAISVKYK